MLFNIFIIVLFTHFSGYAQNNSLELGIEAPGFSLKNVEGKEVTLQSYLGKWVVLVFYRGNWCHLCNEQLSKIAEDYSKFQKLNAHVIAISTDVIDGVKKTIEKSAAPFEILMDDKNEVIKLYQVDVKKREYKDITALLSGHKQGTYAIPALFIIDIEGVIRYVNISESYGDRPDNDEVLKQLSLLRQMTSPNLE
ncbi:MAG: redoxin domain-containing protein [Bacteroidetes bacterium]|nr:redoxin domain-containing protein [Bacteroidota bacterium]